MRNPRLARSRSSFVKHAGLWQGPKVVVLFAIRAYQRVVSPWLGPRCRFYPSCSQYAAQAVETYGPGRGMLLAMGRLARCHPFNRGGFDPVPAPAGLEASKPRDEEGNAAR